MRDEGSGRASFPFHAVAGLRPPRRPSDAWQVLDSAGACVGTVELVDAQALPTAFRWAVRPPTRGTRYELRDDLGQRVRCIAFPDRRENDENVAWVTGPDGDQELVRIRGLVRTSRFRRAFHEIAVGSHVVGSMNGYMSRIDDAYGECVARLHVGRGAPTRIERTTRICSSPLSASPLPVQSPCGRVTWT
jgi:hypothetical protein